MSKPKKSKGDDTIIVINKKASHDYFLENRLEAGLMLLGWEVKSLRQKKVQLIDSHIFIKNGEAFLFGANIVPLASTNTHSVADPTRSRKLLLHKDEIRRLIGKVEQKGYTLVPLNLHWKNGRIKCEIALAKGKAEHDKRDTIKDREGKREVERAMKSRTR